MLRNGTLAAISALAALAAAFSLLQGCGGSAAQGAALSAAQLETSFPAPPPEAPRSAAFDPANLSVPGGEWDQGQPFSRVSLEHNEAILSPDSPAGGGLNGLAFCIYSVLLEDYSGPASIDFNFGPAPPAPGSCFIGLARPGQRWDWQALPDDTLLSLDSFAPYTYDSGVMLVAVALSGSAVKRLYSFQVGPYQEPGDLPLETITLPAGFSISTYAYPVPNARAMCRDSDGTVYVGSRSAGVVYALRDFDLNGVNDDISLVASGINEPVGVDVKDGDLYFSAISAIYRISDIAQHIDEPAAPELVYGSYPTEQHHGWKFIRFGPQGQLFVPVGAPCNICDAGDPYANITRMHADLQGYDIIARGIRNTVGFDWHPVTGELWFTDNGRDEWGPDTEGTSNNPPCELNRIDSADASPHFGYPHFHGMSQPDPDPQFSAGENPADYSEPVQPLGTHVAPLGMRFYTGSMFPADYQGDVFIAEHGSWNRTPPLGARVTRVRVNTDNETSDGYEIFAEGWQDEFGGRWGRPVDVLVMPDGALLVSDDQAGAIYRISYSQ